MTTILRLLKPPTGRGSRRVVAFGMIIMALGRLGLYSARPLADALPQPVYGGLLLVTGLALYINGHFRLSIGGRAIAALGCVLLCGLAWDAGQIGVTTLLELWWAYILFGESVTSRDC